jgi:hypothetical protein
MADTGNPVAEVLDTFFNGRPAPKSGVGKVDVHLTRKQLGQLALGRKLTFKAGAATIIVIPPEPS